MENGGPYVHKVGASVECVIVVLISWEDITVSQMLTYLCGCLLTVVDLYHMFRTWGLQPKVPEKR